MVAGLGNPGPKYAMTRHNAGFIFLDLWAMEVHGGTGGRGAWARAPVDAPAEVCRIRDHGVEWICVKPMGFMNNSGASVASLVRYFKVDPSRLVVCYDDVDVPAGRVKARVGGGHGGHNGVRDIIEKLGSVDFLRVKLGVGRPPDLEGGTADWVLREFSDAELAILKDSMYRDAHLRLEQFVKGDRREQAL